MKNKRLFNILFLNFALALFIMPGAVLATALPTNQVPTFDGSNLAQNTITAASTKTTAVKETIGDKIAVTLGKALIRNISRSTINWINSGFEGGPTFVTDPTGFLMDTADEIAGGFISGSELGFLCDPFEVQIKRALAINYGLKAYGFTNRISCTLSDVIDNTQNAVDGAFEKTTQNTWDSWYKKTQKPENNPYGAYFEAESELGLRIATAQGEQIMKWEWGNGFQSILDEYGKIVTPGKAIENQLANVMGDEWRQLELADEINEIVGALAGQMVMQITNSVKGLSGAKSNNIDNYGISTKIDNQEPVISLSGLATESIKVGDQWQDSGATAYDYEDGDLTSRMIVTNTVDTSTAGTYFVTYFVRDNDGGTITKVRTVLVEP